MSLDSTLEASVDFSFSIVFAGGAVGDHGLVVILADGDQWLAVLASVYEDLFGPDPEVVDRWLFELVELVPDVLVGCCIDDDVGQ